jgi:hypothetical protein
VTTGWNNQQAIDSVSRALQGGSSGRIAVFVIAASFLTLGIFASKLWLSLPFGIATAAAAWTLVKAGRNALAIRRMQRRSQSTAGNVDSRRAS